MTIHMCVSPTTASARTGELGSRDNVPRRLKLLTVLDLYRKALQILQLKKEGKA